MVTKILIYSIYAGCIFAGLLVLRALLTGEGAPKNYPTEEYRPLNEGLCSKGGINTKPPGPRPDPPKGQGGE